MLFYPRFSLILFFIRLVFKHIVILYSAKLSGISIAVNFFTSLVMQSFITGERANFSVNHKTIDVTKERQAPPPPTISNAFNDKNDDAKPIFS